jgi:ribosomal protein S18 acetylase RimI-like enzyme
MREYVEADLGDCFEAIARPTITDLIAKGLFSTIEVDGLRVGAIAGEQHETHYQLEELYVEPVSQNRGIGNAIMAVVVTQASLRGTPIRLHVLASNRARGFYERLGFMVTGTTKEVAYMERMP